MHLSRSLLLLAACAVLLPTLSAQDHIQRTLERLKRLREHRASTVITDVTALASASGSGFGRQVFLAAVKDRLKTQTDLMDVQPGASAAQQGYSRWQWRRSGDGSGLNWQDDLVAIAGVPLPQTEGKARFDIALAFLASKEVGLPFSSRRGTGLVTLEGADPNNLYVHVDTRFGQFVGVLLTTMFDDSAPCRFQGFFRYGPAEAEFANSVCEDLKRVVADTRTELADARLLATEKRNAATAVQRARDLLAQAKGYQSRPALEASIASAETVVVSSDLNDIRAKLQVLTTGIRDVEQFMAVQRAKAEVLAKAREAGSQQLARTQLLLSQAQGYSDSSQVVAAQRQLEVALAGENVEQINARLQEVVATSQHIDQYMQEQKAAAERKRQHEHHIRAFIAAKQRGEKAVVSARSELGKAASLAGDARLTATVQTTTRTLQALSLKLQSRDPKDEAQISALTDKLASGESQIRALARQTAVLSSATGKRVFQGCMAWAEREGMVSPVRVFKDDATNSAANQGESLCRCMAIQIGGDREITDEAKVEIARQFETRDRIDNQQLALIVGVAGARCQMDGISSLIGR